ncbi:HNH endonuclease signature motif containing protein [Cryobacterium psychrotolerans]|uniref:HNH endonuclease signature motif containing protein n=1 Tax=Cryobacterium psychrotolerans TaxID=386301 RepID=UPI001073D364|nr:HNH endonuclease signature motif containing protein [Cryobacterium psychrotolerans]TFD83053.1 HNH endonuclease [Cryobacterium psychrotolerans]
MDTPTEAPESAAGSAAADGADALASLAVATAQIGEALRCSDVRGFGDDGLLMVTAAIEEAGRRVDALRVAAAAEIADRSRFELGTGRLSAKKGCRTPSELVQRMTLVSGSTANRRMRLGSQVRTDYSIIGEALPPKFPATAAGLATGALGLDAAEAILGSLTPTLNRANLENVQLAETELVAAATGQSMDTCVPATADEIRLQASVWKPVLDPDGARPDDERAFQERGLRLGRERGGTIPVSGRLLPEIGGQMQRLFDAYLSPKSAPVAFLTQEQAQEELERSVLERSVLERSVLERDDRTFDQRRHDVLAVILDVAARSAEAPTIGGAAPTVLVTVRQKDLLQEQGVGWIDGIETPLSMRAVKQKVCTGGIQPVVFGDENAICSLGVPDRCFNREQRRAISARDGGCIIPGCQIPASWSEIHHVIPDAFGGDTHTDNGVLLCWFHHRTIETSGWKIRMLRGVPQLKAPPWLDPGGGKWRYVTTSRTRIADALDLRMGQSD